MTTSTLKTSYYANTTLGVSSVSGGVYYTRDATNVLNATTEDAVDLGTLETDSTALHALGKVLRENATDYYKFTLDGSSMKLNFSDLTDDDNLRVQILNSAGRVIADNEGTEAQQSVYDELTSSTGHEATAGDYYVKVTYSGTTSRSVDQTYSFTLYSGTKFHDLYTVKASAQKNEDQAVEIDKTETYATGDAEKFSNKEYNSIAGSATNAVMIGWLLKNKSALSLTSQLTSFNDEHFYSFTFQQGEAVKLAFTDQTDDSDLRVQLFDSTGKVLMADSEGTDEQKAAYEKLISADGLKMSSRASYVVKVSFAEGADKAKAQTYDFKLYSGDSYSALYTTTASSQTFDNAYASGDWAASRGYSQSSNMATYLYNLSQGNENDVMSVLQTVV